ncbi:MAG: hypothetical protein AB1758_33320, partial [Candidatus Eremiobacterota bacterium]
PADQPPVQPVPSGSLGHGPQPPVRPITARPTGSLGHGPPHTPPRPVHSLEGDIPAHKRSNGLWPTPTPNAPGGTWWGWTVLSIFVVASVVGLASRQLPLAITGVFCLFGMLAATVGLTIRYLVKRNFNWAAQSAGAFVAFLLAFFVLGHLVDKLLHR